MARTELPITTIGGATGGIAPATEAALDPAASPDGNVVKNISPTTWLELTCTVTGPVNVVLETPGNVGGRAIADDTITLSGIGTKRRVGPFSEGVFGKDLNINGPATVTCAAYQAVPPS
jgi:hypothetical protein